MGWVVPWRRGWPVQSKEAERLHEEKVGKRAMTAGKGRDGQGEASAQRSWTRALGHHAGGRTVSLVPDHSRRVSGGSEWLTVQLIRPQSHEPQRTMGQSDLAVGGPRMRYAHTTVHSLKVFA